MNPYDPPSELHSEPASADVAGHSTAIGNQRALLVHLALILPLLGFAIQLAIVWLHPAGGKTDAITPVLTAEQRFVQSLVPGVATIILVWVMVKASYEVPVFQNTDPPGRKSPDDSR